MGDAFDTVTVPVDPARPLRHGRILVIMAVLGVIGSLFAWIYVGGHFALGLFIGFALAFANYYWLRHSLRRIFAAAEHGERPRMLAAKYFVRYLVLGAIVAVIYFSGILPIAAVIVGMAGFGLAAVIEGFIRIFSGIFSDKEI
ncbi:MAG: ATP synthase subunit I [Acidobacteriota bacterium]